MEDVLTNFPKKALAGLSLAGLSSLVVIEPLREKKNKIIFADIYRYYCFLRLKYKICEHAVNVLGTKIYYCPDISTVTLTATPINVIKV